MSLDAPRLKPLESQGHSRPPPLEEDPFLPRPLTPNSCFEGDITIPNEIALVIEDLKMQKEARRVMQSQSERLSLEAPTSEDSSALIQQTILHLVVFLLISLGSILGWHFNVFGQSLFPWFIPVMGIYLLIWALYYWLNIYVELSCNDQKSRTLFWLHLSLQVVVALTVIGFRVFFPPFEHGFWFELVLAAQAIIVSIHFSIHWVPREFAFLVLQCLVLSIVVITDFILCFEDVHEYPYYQWVALGGATAIILQVAGFAVAKYIRSRSRARQPLMAVDAGSARRPLRREPSVSLLDSPFIQRVESLSEGVLFPRSESSSTFSRDAVEFTSYYSSSGSTGSSNEDLPPLAAPAVPPTLLHEKIKTRIAATATTIPIPPGRSHAPVVSVNISSPTSTILTYGTPSTEAPPILSGSPTYNVIIQ